MQSPRLLWGMTLRGGGWTFPIGAFLGAVYSVLVLGALFFSARSDGTMSQPPPAAPVIVSMTILLALGGGLVGGVIGLVFGPIGGLLCAVATRFFFSTSSAARSFRQTIKILGGVYGLIATPLGLWIIGGFVAPPTGEMTNLMVIYVLPALVGGAAGIFIAGQILQWYQAEGQPARTAAQPSAATV